MADQTSRNMEYFKTTWIGGLLNMVLGRVQKLEDTPPGSSAWGSISGTLADQADLSSALDGKVDTGRTVNGHALTSDVSVTASDVSAIPSSYLDTDGTLMANSDSNVATQKAVKTYVDAHAGGGGGKVLQVQFAILQSVFSATSVPGGTFTDATGLSVSLTPISVTSKVLVTVCLFGSNSVSGSGWGWRIMRGTTEIAPVATSPGTRQSAFRPFCFGNNDVIAGATFTVLDSPASTSAQTYKVQVCAQNSGDYVYLNRSATDGTNGAYNCRTACSITAMEIAA